jgi:hypothetical protein
MWECAIFASCGENWIFETIDISANCTEPLGQPALSRTQLSFTRSLDDVLRVLHGCYRHAVQDVLDKCETEVSFLTQWVCRQYTCQRTLPAWGKPAIQ